VIRRWTASTTRVLVYEE